MLPLPSRKSLGLEGLRRQGVNQLKIKEIRWVFSQMSSSFRLTARRFNLEKKFLTPNRVIEKNEGE
jgi:hypothetical protein